MFVGEAPGFHEDKQGVPFVGAAGQLLGKLLDGIGLQREDVYIANVLKCRPPGNRDPQPDEIEACEGHLFRQIELIRPKVVATLGNFSTKLLSGKPLGITRVHGVEQEVTLGGSRVLLYPLFHPAAALYTPRMLDVLETDFRRLPELLGRTWRRPRPPPRRAAAPPEPRLRRRSGGRARSARPLLSPVRPAAGRDYASPPWWSRRGLGGRRRRRWARGSRPTLRAGDVVAVAGELGAGKTTFVRGACRELGVDGPVSSPTFTIGHRYEAPVPVAHLDLYRVTGPRAGGVGRPGAVLRWHDCVRRVARARGRLAAARAGGRQPRARRRVAPPSQDRE